MNSRARTLSAPAWTVSPPAPSLLVRDDKHDVAYLPSWDFGGKSLGGEHREIAERVAGIEGKLYPEDAQKLYELAWFTPGPILEIGVFRGRSTTVMARGLAAAGNPAQIVSVDIDPTAIAAAGKTVDRHGLGDRVTLVEATVGGLLSRAPDLRPGFVFVDGDHTFRGVTRDLDAMAPVVPNGAIIAMHDYEGYADEDPYWIQVAAAADASWMASECEFIGRFGLSGVFVRRRGGPAPCDPSRPDPPLVVRLERGVAISARVRRWATMAFAYRWSRFRRILSRWSSASR